MKFRIRFRFEVTGARTAGFALQFQFLIRAEDIFNLLSLCNNVRSLRSLKQGHVAIWRTGSKLNEDCAFAHF